MKREILAAVLTCIFSAPVRAGTEEMDLRLLAKEARPAVMLLLVYDSGGKEIATGTGFLVSPDGKLITNFHVIENATSAIAKADTGGLFPVAGLLASDQTNDLALLKLHATRLPFLTLGTKETVEVGSRVAVIGSPLGLEGTLSEGIVSALREVADRAGWLQITAAISPGSSGSPVLNARGQVVGVATLVVRGGQSLNFAVSAEASKRLLSQGLSLQPLEPQAREKALVLASEEFKGYIKAQEEHRYADALKIAKAIVSRFPSNVVAMGTLSATYFNLGLWEEAAAASRDRIKLKPDDDTGWDSLAVSMQ